MTIRALQVTATMADHEKDGDIDGTKSSLLRFIKSQFEIFLRLHLNPNYVTLSYKDEAGSRSTIRKINTQETSKKV